MKKSRITNWIIGLNLWQTRALFFLAGFVEDFMFVGWIYLAVNREIALVVVFVFVWQYMRSLYFLIPQEIVAERGVVFWDILGNALGAGVSLLVLPMSKAG